MARYLGPKLRKRQRFGLAPESASIRRKNQRPPKMSDYGERLFQKQKLKFIYGIMEKQMQRYAKESFKGEGDSQIKLLQRLEMRLDNIVYRLGIGKTREQARQIVNHGHILIDDNKVTIPSYKVKVGQVITLNPKMSKKHGVLEKIEENRKEIENIGFLEYQKDGGRFLSIPSEKELPKDVDMAKVVEFYSRII